MLCRSNHYHFIDDKGVLKKHNLAINSAMSDEDLTSRSRGSLEFAESSVIQAIVPESTEADFEEKLASLLREDGNLESLLHTVPIRSSLFFGISHYP